MVIQELRQKLRNILKEKEDSIFESDVIISHITKKPKHSWLLQKEVSSEISTKCIELAKQRANGEPLQYLISEWEFYGIPIKVGQGVLIPRADTETLVDIAIKLASSNAKIVDLCAGSGCISAAIAKNLPNSHITAIELSTQAISYAKKNLLPFQNNVNILNYDVLNKTIPKKFQNIDIIVCNPPYLTLEDMSNLQDEVKFEPSMALYGGVDGLLFYKQISKIWKESLKKDGWIVFEIGHSQKSDVLNILKQNEFINTKSIKDLSGNSRVVIGQNPTKHN